jgi:hypothetical protein
MVKSKRPTQTDVEISNEEAQDFYESMPYVTLPHVDYRDDPTIINHDDELYSAQTDLTALFAVFLLGLVAVAVVLLIGWSIATY